VEVGDGEEARLVMKAAAYKTVTDQNKNGPRLLEEALKARHSTVASTDTRASGICCPGCIRVAH